MVLLLKLEKNVQIIGVRSQLFLKLGKAMIGASLVKLDESLNYELQVTTSNPLLV